MEPYELVWTTPEGARSVPLGEVTHRGVAEAATALNVTVDDPERVAWELASTYLGGGCAEGSSRLDGGTLVVRRVAELPVAESKMSERGETLRDVYTLTWRCGDSSVTVPLRDLTPADVLDAAANADLPCDLFTDTFLTRLLYALTYQVLRHGRAEVAIDGVGVLAVRRAL